MLPRRDIPELLDDDLGRPDEIDLSLADLRRINRWFGGISTSDSLLRRAVRKAGASSLSVLEVGGASGTSQKQLQRRFCRRGISLHFTILDRNRSHLNGQFPSVAGDALELPFADSSFDVVSCALLIHHMQPEQIIAFLRESLRVARTAVVINDLRRAYAHLALIYTGLPLFRSRLTRHDAVASVHRSYTLSELKQLIDGGFSNSVEFSSHYLFRMGVIVWK